MVVKIYTAAPSCSAAVNYNERKVAEGHASVIFSSSIDNPKNPMDTFTVYENGSLRCQNRSFHASVNPGKNDHLSDDQIKAFVKEYMEKMGYEKQPYILYKHTDIERTHYHIVSVRVDENGHKIPDSYERRRSQEVMAELAEKYGFHIGSGKELKEVEDQDDFEKKEEEKFEFNPYDGFDPEKGHVSEQIIAIVELAKTYYFKEPQQFDYVMEALGVQVSRTEVDGKVIMGFRGMDPKTKEPCTPIVTLSGENANLPEWIEQHVAECKKLIKNREKEKVDNLARYAVRVSCSQKHFENLLKKQGGIIVRISRNVDGKIFGVVFIDTKTKCVFKGSELPKFKVQELEEARKNRWYDEDSQKEQKHDDAAEEMADLLLSGLEEKNRHFEDEEIMRRGRKKHN